MCRLDGHGETLTSKATRAASVQTLLEEEVETRESAGEHDSCRKLIKLMARAGEVWNHLNPQPSTLNPQPSTPGEVWNNLPLF